MKARDVGVCRRCGDTQPRYGKADAYRYCERCHPSAIQRKWTSSTSSNRRRCARSVSPGGSVRSSWAVQRFGIAHRISRMQDRLLDRIRDPSAASAAGVPGTTDTFAALIDEEYALLVTFRRSGEPVPTPVWFGMHDGRVYVESLADAGKVKRLRRDRRVRVAPCTLRGKPKGPFADGVGRIIGATEEQDAEAALDRHYGLRRRLYVRLGTRLGVRSVYLELTPTRLDHA